MPYDPREAAPEILLRGQGERPWRSQGDPEAHWQLQGSRRWRPPTDVFETEDAYTVVVEIAGMRGADISVTFEKQVLSIRGHRSVSGSQKAYHQMEIAYGEFETQVRVPEPVEVAQVEAIYTDGFLRVTLPKARPHRVEIGG